MTKGKRTNLVDIVKAELEWKMQLSALDIQVDAKENTIMLSGIVDTLAEKTFAQKVATGIAGVQKVENYLAIGTDGTLTDNEITAHVEQHLYDSEHANRLTGVGVKVEGGSAVLMGRVNNLSAKMEAIEAAQKAAGIKDVVSTIKIDPPDTEILTDDQIISHIVQRYASSGLSTPDIEIDTEDGAVFLHGYVEDEHMMELAQELAMEVPGVKKLKNYLKIR